MEQVQFLNFKMTAQQAQYMLNVLATRPYSEVFELVGLIQQQAAAQHARGSAADNANTGDGEAA